VGLARVHLPSGAVVRISEAAARRAAAKPDRSEAACLRELEILGGPGVLEDEAGVAVDPLDLPLRDAHTLRALVLRAGILPEPEGDYTCGHCGIAFHVAPSRLFEPGPFFDGELDDPDLDAPFEFAKAHSVGGSRVGSRPVRLAERTARQSLPLWRAAAADELRLSPAVVVAMGVAALGRERRASAIADALASAPERVWREIVELYHAAYFPARLVGVQRCAECKARNDLDVPLERGLPRAAPPPARASARRRAAFPDLDAFEARVRRFASEVYRARGVRNIDLFIDAGVPACDDGGEPLLGCYTPGGTDAEIGIAQSPEVRIFYRTFQSEFERDPDFDVDAEIRETLDHELTHHLHHLAGSDPLDDDERAEIDREEARLVGQREAARRAARGFVGDLSAFARATWPVWLVAFLATALGWCAR